MMIFCDNAKREWTNNTHERSETFAGIPKGVDAVLHQRKLLIVLIQWKRRTTRTNTRQSHSSFLFFLFEKYLSVKKENILCGKCSFDVYAAYLVSRSECKSSGDILAMSPRSLFWRAYKTIISVFCVELCCHQIHALALSSIKVAQLVSL